MAEKDPEINKKLEIRRKVSNVTSSAQVGYQELSHDDLSSDHSGHKDGREPATMLMKKPSHAAPLKSGSGKILPAIFKETDGGKEGKGTITLSKSLIELPKPSGTFVPPDFDAEKLEKRASEKSKTTGSEERRGVTKSNSGGKGDRSQDRSTSIDSKEEQRSRGSYERERSERSEREKPKPTEKEVKPGKRPTRPAKAKSVTESQKYGAYTEEPSLSSSSGGNSSSSSEEIPAPNSNPKRKDPPTAKEPPSTKAVKKSSNDALSSNRPRFGLKRSSSEGKIEVPKKILEEHQRAQQQQVQPSRRERDPNPPRVTSGSRPPSTTAHRTKAYMREGSSPTGAGSGIGGSSDTSSTSASNLAPSTSVPRLAFGKSNTASSSSVVPIRDQMLGSGKRSSAGGSSRDRVGERDRSGTLERKPSFSRISKREKSVERTVGRTVGGILSGSQKKKNQVIDREPSHERYRGMNSPEGFHAVSSSLTQSSSPPLSPVNPISSSGGVTVIRAHSGPKYDNMSSSHKTSDEVTLAYDNYRLDYDLDGTSHSPGTSNTSPSNSRGSELTSTSSEDEEEEEYRERVSSVEYLPEKERELYWYLQMRKFEKQKTSINKYAGIVDLVSDFVHTAQLYGQIIISELSFPTEVKTVMPINIGGQAGGTKYKTHGILFKFALDTGGLYGSDTNAMKVAAHEWRGLNCFHCANIRRIRLPLMCLVDYRGYRIVAISMLPIDSNTLVYGSDSGGVRVANYDPKFAKLMKKAAKVINLKEHLTLDGKTKLFGPTDIEGHKDHRSGEYFLVDYARTMPPQGKIGEYKLDPTRRHLFELLRPELVQANSGIPLNSDVFSGFNLKDEFKSDSAREVLDVTRVMLTVIIPELAEMFQKRGSFENVDFASLLHASGVNIRFLGKLRDRCSRADARDAILDEMVARILKNTFKEEMRSISKTLLAPSDQVFKSSLVSFLKSRFNSPDNIFLRHSIKEMLSQKFVSSLSFTELAPDYDLSVRMTCKRVLMRFWQMIGVTVAPSAPNIENFSDIGFISNDDIETMRIVLRAPPLLSQAKAIYLSMSLSNVYGSEAMRIFVLAYRQFEETVKLNPTNSYSYYYWGKMLFACLEKNEFLHDSKYRQIQIDCIMKIVKAYSLDMTRHMAEFYITIAITRFIADASRKIGLQETMDLIRKLNLNYPASGAHLTNAVNHSKKARRQFEAYIEEAKGRFLMALFLTTKVTKHDGFRINTAKMLEAKLVTLAKLNLLNCCLFSVGNILDILARTVKLKTLKLGEISFTRAEFNELLRVLPATLMQLTFSNITGEEMKVEKEALASPSMKKRITQFTVISCIGFTPATVENMVTLFPKLQLLTLDNCSEIDSSCFGLINKLGWLKEFTYISHPFATTRAVKSSKKMIALSCSLSVLKLHNIHVLEDSGFRTMLSFMPLLTSLELVGCHRLTDGGIAAVSKGTQMLQLERISINKCDGITSKSCGPIASCRNLVALSLFGLGITGGGVSLMMRNLTQLVSLELADFETYEPNDDLAPFYSITFKNHKHPLHRVFQPAVPNKSSEKSPSTAVHLCYNCFSDLTLWYWRCPTCAQMGHSFVCCDSCAWNFTALYNSEASNSKLDRTQAMAIRASGTIGIASEDVIIKSPTSGGSGSLRDTKASSPGQPIVMAKSGTLASKKGTSSSSSGKSLKHDRTVNEFMDGSPVLRSSSQVLIKKPLLKTLNLARMKISESALSGLLCLYGELTSLNISGCKEIKSCVSIASLKNLETLNIADSGVIDSNFDSVFVHLPRLRMVNVSRLIEPITDDTLAMLRSHCPNLTHLMLAGCTKLTNIGVQNILLGSMKLREVDIRDIPRITPEQISHFRYSISELTLKCDITQSSLATVEFVTQDDELLKTPDIATIITAHRVKKQNREATVVEPAFSKKHTIRQISLDI